MTSFAASLRVAGAAFRNRAIRSVLLAFFAFNAVELGAWTAILVYAYDATGPASVGIVAVAQLLPSALLAPFLAALGDRFPRGLREFRSFILAQDLGVRGIRSTERTTVPCAGRAVASDGLVGRPRIDRHGGSSGEGRTKKQQCRDESAWIE